MQRFDTCTILFLMLSNAERSKNINNLFHLKVFVQPILTEIWVKAWETLYTKTKRFFPMTLPTQKWKIKNPKITKLTARLLVFRVYTVRLAIAPFRHTQASPIVAPEFVESTFLAVNLVGLIRAIRPQVAF